MAWSVGDARAQELPAPLPLEFAVKATYLYKLAPFVSWPPETFASPDAAFNICVVGRDPFGGYLEKAVAGHKLGTHPLRVRKISENPAGADCQIAFVGAVHGRAMREALQAFAGKPVLTVADSRAPESAGSIVQFVIVAGRVRFDIDSAAAQRNHLTISSKLLGLALSVKQTGS